MCDRHVVTKFEDISNEILIECFEYFNSVDLFYSFDQLNHRFNELIRALPLHVNFQDIDKLVYDVFCAQILVNADIQTRVYSLRLSNVNTPGQIGDFLSRFAIEQFSHLRSLTFIHLDYDEMKLLRTILPKLSQITTLNLMDSKLVLYGDDTLLPIDNLQTLSVNWVMIFVARVIPIKSLTLSTVSLNDICQLFQYTPFLEYLSVSHVSEEEFDLKYRLSARPVHLKHLNLFEFEPNFDTLADFLRTMSNLRNFTISSSSDDQMLNASRWQELITSSLPFLKNFQFKFAITYDADTYTVLDVAEKFWTDFWLKEHHWYTECSSSIAKRVIVIYTIPYLAQWKQLPLQSTRYCCNLLIDDSQAFKNINHLVVSVDDIFEHGQYYFPNVTSLEIIDSLLMISQAAKQDLVESLTTLINLSKLRHLDITADCKSAHSSVLIQILQLAPQLSSLRHRGCFYQPLKAHRELSRYFTNIRKLDISSSDPCSNHRWVIIYSLCKIIPNLEHLRANANNINNICFLFNYFSNLSSFSSRFYSKDYLQDLEVFKKQVMEHNALYHKNVSNLGTISIVNVNVWMRKI